MMSTRLKFSGVWQSWMLVVFWYCFSGRSLTFWISYQISLVDFTDDPKKIEQMRVGYRTGDMWAPQLEVTEALRVECAHFVDCINNHTVPRSDGQLGLRVVEIIEAANRSMRNKGETVYLQPQGSAL